MIDLPLMMAERPVTLYVYEATEVGLAAGESVRIDELVLDERSEFDLAPYGDLLAPGEHRLVLAPGVYHFRLAGEADLQIDPEAVIVLSNDEGDGKDKWPDPPAMPPSPFEFASAATRWAEHTGVFLGLGEASEGPRPRLRVEGRRADRAAVPRSEGRGAGGGAGSPLSSGRSEASRLCTAGRVG